MTAWIMPVVVVFIVFAGIIKGQPVFDQFIEGAKEGLGVVVRILPPVIGLLVGVSMLQASGALEVLSWSLRPILEPLGVPQELLPLLLLRPVSGNGSLAVLTDLLNRYGPDGYIGKAASVIMSASETTFYTIAVYYGSVGIKRTRYTLPAALTTDFVAFVAAVILCR